MNLSKKIQLKYVAVISVFVIIMALALLCLAGAILIKQNNISLIYSILFCILIAFEIPIALLIPKEIIARNILNGIQEEYQFGGDEYNDYSSLANSIIGTKLNEDALLHNCGWKTDEIVHLKKCIKNKKFMETYFSHPLGYDDIRKIRKHIFNSIWLVDETKEHDNNKEKEPTFTEKFNNSSTQIMEILFQFFCEGEGKGEGSKRIYAAIQVLQELELCSKTAPVSTIADKIKEKIQEMITDDYSSYSFKGISKNGYSYTYGLISKDKNEDIKKSVDALINDLKQKLEPFC